MVEARDQGDIPSIAEARLTLTIVNVANNAPRLELKLQKTVFEDTVIISEDAKNSTFVGKLTVRSLSFPPPTCTWMRSLTV